MKYLLIAPIIVIASYANARTVISVKEVSFPTLEASKIEQIVCLERHRINAESITAYQYERDGHRKAFDYVDVQCKSHEKFKDAPLYFTSSCSYTNKKWDCRDSELHILMTINNSKVDVIPAALKPELAYQMLSKISTYGSFQGISMDEAIGSHCVMSTLKDNERIELDCRHRIIVSTWCPQPQITHCPRVVSLDEQPWD